VVLTTNVVQEKSLQMMKFL